MTRMEGSFLHPQGAASRTMTMGGRRGGRSTQDGQRAHCCGHWGVLMAMAAMEYGISKGGGATKEVKGRGCTGEFLARNS
jgi:hypothetical protein